MFHMAAVDFVRVSVRARAHACVWHCKLACLKLEITKHLKWSSDTWDKYLQEKLYIVGFKQPPAWVYKKKQLKTN